MRSRTGKATKAGNGKAFTITIAALGAAIIAAVVTATLIMNAAATGPGTIPTAQNVDAESGALTFGDGDTPVDTYVDFMCPYCGQFETAYGATLDDLAGDGTITLRVHPIATLDHLSQGTEYSTRAATAAYCVADQDSAGVLPFARAMFEQQPEEDSEGLTDGEIARIAQEASGVDIDDCLAERPYDRFIRMGTSQLPENPQTGGRQTPTLVVDGEYVAVTGDIDVDLLNRLAE